ncbi:MAG: hypothetical protein V1716_00310 [Candidatus Uhrbacteria bacterium]
MRRQFSTQQPTIREFCALLVSKVTADESFGLEETMSRPTDKQLGEIFVDRRNLPSSDSRFVSREAVQFVLDHASVAARLQGANLTDEQFADFIAGRLVRRAEPIAIEPAKSTSTTIVESATELDIENLIADLLRFGIWKFAKGPDGKPDLTETQYGDLWRGVKVIRPAGYADRYPHLLLRDDTVSFQNLCECADTDLWVQPSGCCVQPGVPEFLLGPDGQRLNRAVMFWGYERNLGGRVIDCRQDISVDNIPLIHPDGFWISIQHRDGILRRHAIDLLGSSYGALYAPYVNRFDNSRPRFGADHVGGRNPRWGSGFRGSVLVPVP